MFERYRLYRCNTEGTGGGGTPAAQRVQIEVVPGKGAPPESTTQAGSDWRRMTDDQYKARLEEERERGERRAMKHFGVEKDKRAEALERARKGEYVLADKPAPDAPDYKSEYEKLKAAAPEVETLRGQAEKYKVLVKKQADDAFAKLPEPLQKDLVRRKIEDPEARLAEIEALQQSGLLAALAPPAQQQQQSGAPARAGNTMAPAGPQVPPAEGTKTAWQQYEEIKKSGNKIMAAHFARANAHAIEASRPK